MGFATIFMRSVFYVVAHLTPMSIIIVSRGNFYRGDARHIYACLKFKLLLTRQIRSTRASTRPALRVLVKMLVCEGGSDLDEVFYSL